MLCAARGIAFSTFYYSFNTYGISMYMKKSMLSTDECVCTVYLLFPFRKEEEEEEDKPKKERKNKKKKKQTIIYHWNR